MFMVFLQQGANILLTDNGDVKLGKSLFTTWNISCGFHLYVDIT